MNRALTGEPWMIVDGIAPFFREVTRPRINWSKIPFADLEVDGLPDPALLQRIESDFAHYCEMAAAYGYNAITLDDLAHLVDHPCYATELRRKIAIYQAFYARLFARAEQHGLRSLITTDLMFFNAALDRELGRDPAGIRAFLAHALAGFFERFPRVAGVVTRIGETDGVDVHGSFRSELVIRTPRQARHYLHELLPVFEAHRRWWFFRTWSVGAYRIGDLIWNRETLHATFDDIRSDRLILSMKYGETDFFRYLPLNPQLFRGHLPRVVELQARREYEGTGEYPAFIGGDYEQYRNQLRRCPNLAGVMVWCQTGGWTHFRRLTFGANSSVWNEINTWTALRLFRDGVTAAEAVEQWRLRWAPHLDGGRLLGLLRLSEEVIKELLYIDDYARQKLFFRRFRVPPLLSVFWDHVLVNHPIRQFLRCFVVDGEEKVLQGRRVLEKIREMQRIAEQLGLPVRDIEFQYDTFAILAAAREYYFREFTPEIAERLTALREAYRARHNPRYHIHLDFQPVRLKRARLQRYLAILFRRQRGYRLVDQILTVRLLGWLHPVIRRIGRAWTPEFSRTQAMGVDALFK
ncbi:MAG TPA: hypothetical protein PKE12_08255 [Kiritimatiellia bacterium]|mgnify:CR=1 FL=1|nr:hypothetical protein [Kiritimatiellia bacterium]